jgi:addiction module HigA family antidote
VSSTLTVDAFIRKWRAVELKERSAAQEHFIDLCHVLDEPTPADAEAATVLGITRQALSSLLNGRVSLTPEMALRIEKAFGVKMDKLVQTQTAHDIPKTRARQNEIKVHHFASKVRLGG